MPESKKKALLAVLGFVAAGLFVMATTRYGDVPGDLQVWVSKERGHFYVPRCKRTPPLEQMIPMKIDDALKAGYTLAPFCPDPRYNCSFQESVLGRSLSRFGGLLPRTPN